MTPRIPLLALLATLIIGAAPAPQPIAGRWLTGNGKALVEIGPCGAKICGRVVKVLDPRAPKHATDVHNKNAALRTRKIEGLIFLQDFVPSGESWKGRIYDPQSGKEYASFVRRTGDGLEVKGCWSIFCKTEHWTASR